MKRTIPQGLQDKLEDTGTSDDSARELEFTYVSQEKTSLCKLLFFHSLTEAKCILRQQPSSSQEG